MHDFVVSQAAQFDLREIARYTVAHWSVDQAHKYLAELQTGFEHLAEFPEIGKVCDEVSSGLRRHRSGSHVVFYRVRPGGIRVLRVLHLRMLPDESLFLQRPGE